MAASNKVVLSRLLTVLCLPVTAPLLLAYALVVGVGTAALPKHARQKAHAAAIRVLTMGGPWGTCFDALTWHPWTAGVPSCIYAGVEPSDGKGLVVPVSKLCARAAGTLRKGPKPSRFSSERAQVHRGRGGEKHGPLAT